MSRMPDNLESKYNKDNKFIWVDSQLEKFMTKQKELEEKLSELKAIVKVTPNNYMLGEKIRCYFNNGIEECDDNQMNIF
jgi:hypothetical protein